MEPENKTLEAASLVASSRPEDATSVAPLEEEWKVAVLTVPSSSSQVRIYLGLTRAEATLPGKTSTRMEAGP